MSNVQTIQLKVENGQPFTLERAAVASIDSTLCVNCGICRRACPVKAIEEHQRDICRLCPDCAQGPEIFPADSKAYATRHSCSLACPLGTIPEGYVNLIAEGKFEAAYDLIKELNPLPVICSMICHHPCEDDCKRGLLIDKPIAIRALKRFITSRVEPEPLVFNRRYDTKIAVIGAGPAGITAAADLAAKGYRVKIFEAGPEPGGMLRIGIPNFRVDKTALQNEIQHLLDAGIEIEYDCLIGKNPTIDDLLADHYAAVLIAVGAGKGSILPIRGSNAEKVYDALQFMKKVNADIPVKVGKKAVVIGGGSIAFDTARSLKRLGVADVTCVCLEEGAAVPAPKWEIEEAKEEGVKLIEGAAPTRIVTELFTVEGVEFRKVECIDTDEFGRLQPQCFMGSEFVVDADTVLFATGQKADTRFFVEKSGLALDGAGHLQHDPDTLATSKDKVFVAGDVVMARGNAVEAMASGRKAALAIDNMLQDRKVENRAVERDPKLAPVVEKIYPVRLERLDPQEVPKRRYRDTFEQVEGVFDEQTAMLEAARCMKCGYSFVETERCIGCGVCANSCPENIITMIKPQ
ncbi:FAD-dependent oxidoreductase [Caproiciproducens sp.]